MCKISPTAPSSQLHLRLVLVVQALHRCPQQHQKLQPVGVTFRTRPHYHFPHPLSLLSSTSSSRISDRSEWKAHRSPDIARLNSRTAIWLAICNEVLLEREGVAAVRGAPHLHRRLHLSLAILAPLSFTPLEQLLKNLHSRELFT